MKKRSKRQSEHRPREGPVKPGSVLFQTLLLIAREAADRLRGRSASHEGAGDSK